VLSNLTIDLATAALSLHREDGSAPRLITTPLPNVPSRGTTDERDVGAYLRETSGGWHTLLLPLTGSNVYTFSGNQFYLKFWRGRGLRCRFGDWGMTRREGNLAL
jgi:hypothetical protein